jgi:FkbM family methyltransferase
MSDEVSSQPQLKEAAHRVWMLTHGDKTLRVDYPLNEGSIVLDVGGYHGDWAADIFDKYRCTVHVFEPIVEWAHSIQKRFLGNEKIHVHPFGFGARTEQVLFSIEEDATSSFKHMGKSVEVNIKKAADFIQSLENSKIDLIKINIEGGEYELLEHLLDTGLIERFKSIQVQFHDFVPNASKLREELMLRLRETHFCTYCFDFIWENWELLPKGGAEQSKAYTRTFDALKTNVAFQSVYATELAKLMIERDSFLLQAVAARNNSEIVRGELAVLSAKVNDRSLRGRINLLLGK